MIRWIGFVLVVSGAAAAGISMAAAVRRSGEFYRQAQMALLHMKAEIEFKLTPLAEICGQLAVSCRQPLAGIFGAVETSLHLAPGRPCGVQMRRALQQKGLSMPEELKKTLTELFDTLGKQDVYAQLRAIDMAERRLQSALDELQREKKDRCRSYRVIGVCAGLAVAVILI